MTSRITSARAFEIDSVVTEIWPVEMTSRFSGVVATDCVTPVAASPEALVEPPDASDDLDAGSLAISSSLELSPPLRPAQPAMANMTINRGVASAARDLVVMWL